MGKASRKEKQWFPLQFFCVANYLIVLLLLITINCIYNKIATQCSKEVLFQLAFGYFVKHNIDSIVYYHWDDSLQEIFLKIECKKETNVESNIKTIKMAYHLLWKIDDPQGRVFESPRPKKIKNIFWK